MCTQILLVHERVLDGNAAGSGVFWYRHALHFSKEPGPLFAGPKYTRSSSGLHAMVRIIQADPHDVLGEVSVQKEHYSAVAHDYVRKPLLDWLAPGGGLGGGWAERAASDADKCSLPKVAMGVYAHLASRAEQVSFHKISRQWTAEFEGLAGLVQGVGADAGLNRLLRDEPQHQSSKFVLYYDLAACSCWCTRKL